MPLRDASSALNTDPDGVTVARGVERATGEDCERTSAPSTADEASSLLVGVGVDTSSLFAVGVGDGVDDADAVVCTRTYGVGVGGGAGMNTRYISDTGKLRLHEVMKRNFILYVVCWVNQLVTSCGGSVHVAGQ